MPDSRHAARTVTLDTGLLTPADVEAVARHGAALSIGDHARRAIAASRAVVERALGSGRAIYGVNTGFGSLATTRIEPSQLRELQQNLVRSHASGVGDPLPTETVRAMLCILAASLCRGRSGVRQVVVDRLVAALNAGVTPIVPEIGSVGASGDLAPLAHAILALTGEGEAEYNGKRMPGGEALQAAGLSPIELDAKEGLALLNGTHLMAAQGALLAQDAERMFDAALVAAAMSIDAARATDAFLDPRVYEARNQPGPRLVAERMRALLVGSEIVVSHREHDPRVQDPYSLRCAPIVLGAALDSIMHARACIERELGAVTDNPLVFEGAGPDSLDTGAIVSAGCFHGMPVAIPLDTLAIAMTHIAGISERRTYFILSATDSQNPMPAFLSPRPGLHSGLMIAQYAAAACVNEMIGLAAPASVSNIPTCAGMEDYNSFGPRSAAKARRALDLCAHVVAIELLSSAIGVELKRPLRSGEGVETAITAIRKVVPPLQSDRTLTPDIEAIAGLVRTGALSV